LGATRIGAVNCVARDGEALVGHNTDAPGLVRALRSGRIEPSGRAVVVGAGGSARAAAFALAEHAQGLTILNRTLDRARSLAQSVEAAGTRAQSAALDSPEARRALQEATLVVHCTTVGLEDDRLPFDPALLAPGAAVADLAYRGATGETALIRARRSHEDRAGPAADPGRGPARPDSGKPARGADRERRSRQGLGRPHGRRAGGRPRPGGFAAPAGTRGPDRRDQVRPPGPAQL